MDRLLLASFSNFIVTDLNITNIEFWLLTGLVSLFDYGFLYITGKRYKIDIKNNMT